MREKIVELLKSQGFVVDSIVDQEVDRVVGGMRRDYERVYGEKIPEENKEVLEAMEKAIRDGSNVFFDAVTAEVEKFFVNDPSEINTITSFYTSTAGKRSMALIGSIMPIVTKARDEWTGNALKAIEPILKAKLGGSDTALYQQKVEANSEVSST